MIPRTIRSGQTWSDNGHVFEIVERHAHEIEVRYVQDDTTAFFMEGDFEDFTPL